MLSILLFVALAHGQPRSTPQTIRDPLNPPHEPVRVRFYNAYQLDLSLAGEVKFGGPESARYGVVTFDVKDLRGGNGDVAAGYLMATEWRARYAFQGRIVMVTNARTRRVLSRLIGRNVGARDLIAPDIEIVDVLQITPDIPAADLYIKLAATKGEHADPDWTRNVEIRGHAFATNRVPVHTRTLHVTVPVYSATEDPRNFSSTMAVKYRAVEFTAPPPGPGVGESGIYYDADAARVAKMSPEDVRRELLSGPFGARLKPWLDSDRAPAFAYGLSHAKTKLQFNGFLAGLLHSFRKPIVIFTPSDINPSDFDRFLPEELRLASLDEPVPSDARIVIVRLPDINLPTFNRLLALARDVPPIVSGDASLTAALQMGRRFVMTQVAWNEKIAAEIFAELSTESSSRTAARACARVGRADLLPALDLTDEPFARKAERLQFLSDHLLMYLNRVRRVVDEATDRTEDRDLEMQRVKAFFHQGKAHLVRQQLGFPDAFADGFYRALRSHAIDSNDLSHSLFKEKAEVYTNLEKRGSRPLFLAIEGGREDELEAWIIGAAAQLHPEARELRSFDAWELELVAQSTLQALVAMGTDRAFAILRDHLIKLPSRYESKEATFAYLNHLDDRQRFTEVAEFLDALSPEDMGNLARGAHGARSVFKPRPNVAKALLDRMGQDHRESKSLRKILKRWGDCSSYLDEPQNR